MSDLWGVQWSAEGMVSTTPLLVYEDGRTYHDSSLILEHLAHTYPQQLGHLYPNNDTQKRDEVRGDRGEQGLKRGPEVVVM
jgi:glutathione S-transferase